MGWFRGDGAQVHPSPFAADSDGAGEEAVTLDHVHHAIVELVAEVELLRRAKGVSAAPREAALREDLALVHVCVKALEVAEKTTRVQRRLGMIPSETPSPGVAGLTPKGLHRTVRGATEELRRIKRQLVIDEAVTPAPAAGAGTPSALYRELARASFLLDGLVGRPASRGDVRVRVAQAEDALRPIAARLGTAPGGADAPAQGTDRAPREVAQQVLRATYKAVGLQTTLGMEASGVPAVALEGADEAEALDAANLLLAELLRIQAHLDVGQAPPAAESAPGDAPPVKPALRDAPPADAFGQAMRIVAHLDAMMRAAASHGG